MVKFGSVTNLSIYVQRNYSNDDDVSTMINFIGLKGEYMGVN